VSESVADGKLDGAPLDVDELVVAWKISFALGRKYLVCGLIAEARRPSIDSEGVDSSVAMGTGEGIATWGRIVASLSVGDADGTDFDRDRDGGYPELPGTGVSPADGIFVNRCWCTAVLSPDPGG